MLIFSRFRLGRPAAEAWLKDLEALASCKEAVAAIMAVADKVLEEGVAKQATLHSFFQKTVAILDLVANKDNIK